MIALIAAAAAQDVSIHESMATTCSAGDVRGGTFTGAGWRVDDSGSRLGWDLGAQLARGDLAVTIDGISWDNLLGANNHLVELFSDGGHSSDNRAINLRLYGYGDGDPYGEWGDLKLLGWDRTTNPGGEDLVAEERYYGLDWDGLPHRWRITWDPTDFVLYRDDAELIHMDVTGMDLRVRYLWLPLQDWGGDYCAPVGAVYSDLDLDGWVGTDDDPDPTPTDDGDPDTLLPADDVTAATWTDGVYDDDDSLVVEAGAAVAYLAFDLSDVVGTVTSATLTLHAGDDGSAEGDGATVFVADADWTEDTLTWATRPTVRDALGSFGAVTPDGTYTVDVTAGVRAGERVGFAVLSDGENATWFQSKESGDGSRAAMLTIAVRDEGDADTDTDTDTDADTDADTGRYDDWDGRDPRTRAEPETDDGGCGCDAGAGGGWVGLLGAVAVLRGRRSSPR